MTNAELLAKIKAEIEKEYNESHNKKILAHRDKDYYNETAYGAVMGACNRFLSFLSTLEESEKPMNQEGLDAEIQRVVENYNKLVNGSKVMKPSGIEKIARHFYELGCRRTAEKYDEIEYNRQRAEESEKPTQEELEKEINRWLDFGDKNSSYYSFALYEVKDTARHFAKWGEHHAKEKMRNARRTEEAYQEVAEDMRKQIDGSSEIPKGLEEAAKKYVSTLCNRADEGLRIDTTLESAFIAGGKCREEQMMKQSLDAKVFGETYGSRRKVISEWLEPEIGNPGDKVRIIVISNTDEK